MSEGGGPVPHRARRRKALLGVLAVVLGVVCGSAAFAALSPALLTQDETSHIDYGYRVWHGELPAFEDGTSFTPGAGVVVPEVQWEAQHPPLYYLLIAPAVGPLIDAGHWRAAVMAARAVNILLAAGCVLALAWAGSLLTTRRRLAWAIAVPAVVAPISPFMRVGGSAYNDDVGATLAALSLGMGIVLLRSGPSRRRLLLLALLCGLGGLARGNFVITLIVVTGMVAVGTWLHDRGQGIQRIGRSLAAGVVPFGAALVASGWFYWRNVSLTGSWVGAQTEFAVSEMKRRQRGVVEVLTDPSFWDQQLQLLRQSTTGSADWVGPRVLLVVGGVGLVACAYWSVRFVRQQWPSPTDRPTAARTPVTDKDTDGETRPAARPSPLVVQTAIVAALVAQLCGVILIQVVYAGVGGATISRYLLPGLLPIGALFAAAVLAAGRRLAGLALLIYLTFAWGLFVHWLWLVSTKDGFQIAGSTSNGVPWLGVWGSVVLLALAVVVQAVALTDWPRNVWPWRDPDPTDADPLPQ